MIAKLARVLAVALVAAGVGAPAAAADFGLAPGGFGGSLIDRDGNPETRAGAHPDRLRMNIAFDTAGGANPDGSLKDMSLSLSPGLTGNPTAVPYCPRSIFAAPDAWDSNCPTDTQVGVVKVHSSEIDLSELPISNLAPGPGNVAEFGVKVAIIAARVVARMAPDGQSLSLDLTALQDLPINRIEVEIWGVPADHQTGTPAPRRPLLTMPAACDRPPTTASLRMTSWEQPEEWITAQTEVAGPMAGCDRLSYGANLSLTTDDRRSDTPTGAEVGLTMPQSDDPDGLASAQTRDVHVRLPEGLALSPSAANGLASCSDQEVGIGSANAPRCPAAARLGGVTISSPLMAGPLDGAMYLGRRLSTSQFELFMVASGQGFDVKARGTLTADPETGQLTTVLSDLPAVPFDRIALSFPGGPRAPLVAPLACGAQLALATLVSQDGRSLAVSAPVVFDRAPSGGACPTALPFAPSFVAGTSPARAGRPAPFALTLRRSDGEQPLDRFSMTLPPGLNANIGSAAACAETALAAGACPAASRVGSVAIEVGSGERPLTLTGDAYLTGPYRRAPFGLALAFGGAVGPFDLGNVVVRAALRFDPQTGQVTVDSDALPRVVAGIPLRIRTLALDVDRPGFMVNPTSCEPRRAIATVRSPDVVARSATRFAVGGCHALRFAPKLGVALTDRSQLRADGHPGLLLRLGARAGGANVRSADVRLPKTIGIDAGRIVALCSREQARDGRCPSESRVGSASGSTPLLPGKLGGGVFVVQPRGHGLPDLWVRMAGRGVALNLRMETAVEGGRIRTKLVELPDFPLSSFALRLSSGKRGLFSAKRSPCANGKPRRLAANAVMTAQSEASRRLRAPIRVPGCARRR